MKKILLKVFGSYFMLIGTWLALAMLMIYTDTKMRDEAPYTNLYHWYLSACAAGGLIGFLMYRKLLQSAKNIYQSNLESMKQLLKRMEDDLEKMEKAKKIQKQSKHFHDN